MQARWAVSRTQVDGTDSVDAHKLSDNVNRVLSRIVLVPRMLLIFLVVLVLSPVLLVYGVGWWLRGKWLVRRFREEFGRKGKYAILVYSESPNWQAYFEEHVIAPAGDRAVVLNWSERRLWKESPSLPTRVFLHFKPATEFNPYALVFLPAGRPRQVEFFSAFRDYKHGKQRRLEQSMKELNTYLREADDAWIGRARVGSSFA